MTIEAKIAAEREVYQRWAARSRLGTYDIPETNFRKVEERVEEYARKAEKLGTAPVTMRVLGTYHRMEITDPKYLANPEGYVGTIDDARSPVKYYRVILEGETPKLNGWQFVATLQHEGEKNIVRAIPDAPDMPRRFRTRGPVCDHCQTNRQRNDTYVVFKQGTFKQVGSTCLRDFTGANDPHLAASAAERFALLVTLARDSEDYIPTGGGHNKNLRTDRYLAYVVSEIRQHGWMSRSKARYEPGTATADSALNTMLKPDGYKKNSDYPTEADKAAAEEALTWAREELPQNSDPNDYEWNLMIAAEGEYMEAREAGLIASVVIAYRKSREWKSEREAKEEAAAASEWQGEIKERRDWRLIYKTTFSTETHYGAMDIHSFEDEAGNFFKWFTSSDAPDMVEGQVYTVRGTVKKHAEWNDAKETHLTRCSFPDTVAYDAPIYKGHEAAIPADVKDGRAWVIENLPGRIMTPEVALEKWKKEFFYYITTNPQTRYPTEARERKYGGNVPYNQWGEEQYRKLLKETMENG